MQTHRIQRRRQGFTLIELLVVIIILAILAAVVIPRVIGRTDDAKQGAAIASVSNFDQSLELYKVDVGTFPSTDQGLQALLTNVSGSNKWNGPYFKGSQTLPLDPWSNPYNYRMPSEHGMPDYDVFSAGPDGQVGTADDIGNWR